MVDDLGEETLDGLLGRKRLVEPQETAARCVLEIALKRPPE
jgi:hypothetical protein